MLIQGTCLVNIIPEIAFPCALYEYNSIRMKLFRSNSTKFRRYVYKRRFKASTFSQQRRC
jgi:hypothetical protein